MLGSVGGGAVKPGADSCTSTKDLTVSETSGICFQYPNTESNVNTTTMGVVAMKVGVLGKKRLALGSS